MGFCFVLSYGLWSCIRDDFCFLILPFAVLNEFKELLKKQATVEAFTEWLDQVVETKVIKVGIMVDLVYVTLTVFYMSS